MRRTRAEDRRLARKLLDGDERAYEQLFADQVPRLYRIVLPRLSGDEDAAQDVVQQGLIQAIGKLHTFRAEASLLTWLTTFCLREVSAHYRRLRRAPTPIGLTEEVSEVAAALELLEQGEEIPEREALRSELRRLVLLTLDRLPQRYADVLEWKYVDDLSVKEIAERWRTRPTAVQSVLARARGAFRKAFRSIGEATTEVAERERLAFD